MTGKKDARLHQLLVSIVTTRACRKRQNEANSQSPPAASRARTHRTNLIAEIPARPAVPKSTQRTRFPRSRRGQPCRNRRNEPNSQDPGAASRARTHRTNCRNCVPVNCVEIDRAKPTAKLAWRRAVAKFTERTQLPRWRGRPERLALGFMSNETSPGAEPAERARYGRRGSGRS